MKEQEKIPSCEEPFDFSHGGFISRMLWAVSIIKLEQAVAYNRHKLEAHFDEEIKRFPKHKNLAEKKDRCLQQFDEANMDTISNVAKAKEFFAQYPEFSGLLISDASKNPKDYWDSFDCQVQCEEIYHEHGVDFTLRPSDDECEPF